MPKNRPKLKKPRKRPAPDVGADGGADDAADHHHSGFHFAERQLDTLRSSLNLQLESQGQADSAKHWILDHVAFKTVVFGAIFLNIIQMGVEVDQPQWSKYWNICESVFTALFLFEAGLKGLILRRKYFHDSWNILDLFLVVLSVFDVWIFGYILGSAVDVDLQMMSMLRVLRLFRLVRVLKLAKRMRKCVLILNGVLHAVQAAGWTSVLLFGMLYMGGIATRSHFAGDSVYKYPGYTTDIAEIDETDLVMEFNPQVYFGSLPGSMLTLYNIAIMAEWPEVVRPIMLKEPAYVLAFVLFSILTTFGVINVIVAMIVESVLQSARDLQEEDKQKDVSSKLAILDDLNQLWRQLGESGDEVTMANLMDAIKTDPKWSALLGMIQLPRGYGAKEVFQMLDDDGTSTLNHDEFVGCFYRLIDSGPFQQLCMLQKGINDIKTFLRQATDLSAANAERLSKIEAALCEENATEPSRPPPGCAARGCRGLGMAVGMQPDYDLAQNGGTEISPILGEAVHKLRPPSPFEARGGGIAVGMQPGRGPAQDLQRLHQKFVADIDNLSAELSASAGAMFDASQFKHVPQAPNSPSQRFVARACQDMKDSLDLKSPPEDWPSPRASAPPEGCSTRISPRARAPRQVCGSLEEPGRAADDGPLREGRSPAARASREEKAPPEWGEFVLPRTGQEARPAWAGGASAAGAGLRNTAKHFAEVDQPSCSILAQPNGVASTLRL